MYKKIVNPHTGRKVNIRSKLGMEIISNYRIMSHQSGGAITFMEQNLKTKKKLETMMLLFGDMLAGVDDVLLYGVENLPNWEDFWLNPLWAAVDSPLVPLLDQDIDNCRQLEELNLFKFFIVRMDNLYDEDWELIKFVRNFRERKEYFKKHPDASEEEFTKDSMKELAVAEKEINQQNLEIWDKLEKEQEWPEVPTWSPPGGQTIPLLRFHKYMKEYMEEIVTTLDPAEGLDEEDELNRQIDKDHLQSMDAAADAAFNLNASIYEIIKTDEEKHLLRDEVFEGPGWYAAEKYGITEEKYARLRKMAEIAGVLPLRLDKDLPLPSPTPLNPARRRYPPLYCSEALDGDVKDYKIMLYATERRGETRYAENISQYMRSRIKGLREQGANLEHAVPDMKWEDFGKHFRIDVQRHGHNDPPYLLYEDARAFARTQELESANEWVNFCNRGECPSNIPIRPDKIKYYYPKKFNDNWSVRAFDWDDWLNDPDPE